MMNGKLNIIRAKGGFARAILFLSLVLVIFYLYGTWFYPTDDAYISYRYAQNLAEGNGLVYNLGERVEGYSNFLWVLINSIPFYFGCEDPIYFSIILSMALYFLLVVVFIKALQKEVDRLAREDAQIVNFAYFAIFGLLLLAVDIRFFLHMNTGLETIFFCTIFFLAVFWEKITSRKWRYLWSLLLVLLLLIRADGFVYAGILLFAFFIKTLVKRESLRGFFTNLGIFVIAVIIYLGWRWSYYHELLPNTYYAKTTALSYEQELFGFVYTIKFLSSMGLVMLFSLVGLFYRSIKENIHFLILIISVMIYITYIGGDWMPHDRFYIPLIPIFCLFAGIGAIKLAQYVKRFKVIISLVILMLVVVNLLALVHTMSLRKIFHMETKYHEDIVIMKDIGLYIKNHSDEDDKIAVNFAGMVPYYSRRYTIDMTGLNDKHIASLGRGLHKNWDVEYVLSKKPLYIMMYSKPKMDEVGIHFVWGGAEELYYHPLFQKNYSLHKEWIHPEKDVGYYLFKREEIWSD